MRRGQFLKFAKDCMLINDTLDLIEINLVFVKVNAKSKIFGDNEMRLSFKEFVDALHQVAMKLHPHASPDESFKATMEKNVVPNAQAVPTDDAIGEALGDPEVLRRFKANHPKLRSLFEYYSKIDVVRGHGLQWQDITHSSSHVSLNEFLKFTADFDIIPDILAKSEVTKAFREANFSKKRSSTDTTKLSFPEFEDCLGRCALAAYGFVVEEAKGEDTTFNDNYSSEARRIWVPPYAPQGKVSKVTNPARSARARKPETSKYYWEAGLPAKFHAGMVANIEVKQQAEDLLEGQKRTRQIWNKYTGKLRLKDRVTIREDLESISGMATVGAGDGDARPAKGRGLTVQDLRATLAPSRPISNHRAKRDGAGAAAPAALATGL